MKSITRYISITAIFIIPLFALFPIPHTPFDIANNLFFPFITGKAFYFRILVEIAFASWAILAFLDAKYRPKLNALTVAVTAFAAVTLAADLLGVNPIRSMWSNFERMEGWMTIIHLWMFFMAASSLFGSGEEGKRWWHYFLNFELAVAFIVGIYGLIQLFGWTGIHQGSARIDASLGNAEYMAVYMLINAGLAIYMLFSVRSRMGSIAMQWLYGVIGALFAFEVYETATRGTILGLAGAIMLALFLYAVLARDHSNSKKSRWISGGVIALIIILGFVLWLNRSSSFVQKNDILYRLANISWSNSQGQARNFIWPMAINGWSQRPILGWGQENFNYIFNANYNPKMWTQEQWFDRAHSVYLDWLTASGLVGFLAYLSLYVFLLAAIWKRSGLGIAEKSILTGLVAGYAIHNIFVFDNIASYILFFTLLGFASSFNGGDAQEAPKTIGGERDSDIEIVEYIVAPVFILLLIGSVYYFNIRAISSNLRLINALHLCSGGNVMPDAVAFDDALAVDVYVSKQEIREQLLACSGAVLSAQQLPGPTKQAFFQDVVKNIQDQISEAPKDARMYVLGGTFLNNLQQFQMAEKVLEYAHALSPKKQVVNFELATNYLNLGKSSQAVALLKEAYEADPTYPQARTSFGLGMIIVGKEAEARKALENDPTVFETAQAANLFASLKQYDKAIVIYKKLIAASPKDSDLRVGLARTQLGAGTKSQAIETLKSIEADHPELKEQVEATIKTIQ